MPYQPDSPFEDRKIKSKPMPTIDNKGKKIVYRGEERLISSLTQEEKENIIACLPEGEFSRIKELYPTPEKKCECRNIADRTKCFYKDCKCSCHSGVLASTTPSWEEVVNNIAHEQAKKYEDEREWKQPYAGNRILHTGWEIAKALKPIISQLLKVEREKAYERGRNSMMEEIMMRLEEIPAHTVIGGRTPKQFMIEELKKLEDGKNNIK